MCRSGSITSQFNIPQTSSGGEVASSTLLDSMPNNAAITGKRRSSRPATATVYAGRLHNSGPSTHSTCLHLSEGSMALAGYGYSGVDTCYSSARRFVSVVLVKGTARGRGVEGQQTTSP
jgi:hypothetical protein